MSEKFSVEISVSEQELEAIKTPEDLVDLIEIHNRCAIECLIKEIGNKYPCLVNNGDVDNEG